MLDGEHRAAGGDMANERQAGGQGGEGVLKRAVVSGWRAIGQADATGAAIVENDRAFGRECTQMTLGGVGRVKTEGGTKLGARGRATCVGGAAANELKNFLLACGQGFVDRQHGGEGQGLY
ncbi:hypothetical protein AGMMS49960_19230 [Betaproteobacteria bacterium]|nr:hypothetical protein AGMMS49960_19230 [Betaproteobacteria bacterium]